MYNVNNIDIKAYICRKFNTIWFKDKDHKLWRIFTNYKFKIKKLKNVWYNIEVLNIFCKYCILCFRFTFSNVYKYYFKSSLQLHIANYIFFTRLNCRSCFCWMHFVECAWVCAMCAVCVDFNSVYHFIVCWIYCEFSRPDTGPLFSPFTSIYTRVHAFVFVYVVSQSILMNGRMMV